MAAPSWFVEHLEELRQLPGSRPISARTLATWAAQVGDGDAPSRPTISRWISGSTLPTSFEPLEVLVSAVRERTKNPSRQARETLLRSGWWREIYERALTESGRGDGSNGQQTPVVYQGMDPFGRADAARFFGRGRAIEAVRDRLDALVSSASGEPLVVLGPSGVGKSSLLAAGVLPALESHGLPSRPEASGWPSTIISPGPDPLRSLSNARLALLSEAPRPEAGGHGKVLVVDQFEEIFQVDREVQARFLAELADLAVPTGGHVPEAGDVACENGPADIGSAALIVLVSRNDFYPELRGMQGLGAALDRPYNLDPMTGEELTEAILMPARQAGISVGQDLVTRLVSDAGVSASGTVAGQLPLISHVLRVMNQAGPMTVRAYERVGGIDGAVAFTATRAWEALRRSGLEATALALLVRLVRVGDYPGHDARRQLDREELLAPGEGNETEQALRILSVARLVTSSQDTVQITHDALLRSWDRLRDTIDGQRAELLLRQNIELRARQWDEAGRPPEHLLRGTVLAAAHGATDGAPVASTTDLSREFLAVADDQECQIAARRRRLRLAAIAAVVLIIAAGTVAVVEGVAEHRVSQRAVLAEVMAQARAVQQSNPSLAAQLYLTAYRMQPDPDLYTTLIETENQPLAQPLEGHRGTIRAVAQAGASIVSGGDDGTVRVWAAGPAGADAVPTVLHEPGRVGSLAADRSRSLVVTSEDNALPGQSALRVWNVADPRHPVALTAELASGAGHINGLTTSEDGRLLAATASDGTARLFDLADPTHPRDLGPRLPGVTSSVYGSSLGFSPDGRLLAVAGDQGSIQLWDINDPARPIGLAPLPSGSSLSHAVTFSPTNPRLLVTGGNSALRLWDTSDPAAPRLLSQPAIPAASSVLATAVSPDGGTLATASSDDTVTLWNIIDPTRPLSIGAPLAGSTRGIGAVTFSPDGRSLVAAGADAIVRVWSLPPSRLPIAGTAADLTYSHRGTLLAAGDVDDALVYLWDTATPDTPVPLGPPLAQGGERGERDAPGFDVAFTPDDSSLFSGAGTTVRRWNLRNPRSPAQLEPDLVLPAAIGGLAISPDGRTLAVGATDGTTRLFLLAGDAAPVPLGVSLPSTTGEVVSTLSFSPDGRTLAGAGSDHKIWLWDVSDPGHAHSLGGPLVGHTDKIYGSAFSPDSRYLATSSYDHTLRIWDTADPTRAHAVGPPLVEQSNVLGAAAWSADGSTVATAGHDRTVALWNVTDPNRPAPVGQPLTGHTDSAYSVKFDPRAPIVASGGRDQTVLLSNLDVEVATHRICTATAGTLTEQAWNTFVSADESYDPPCGTGAAQ